MAQIRQEISILTHALAGAVTSNEFVQLDTTQYNGTVTYYFEIVAAISSGSAAVTLRDKGDSSDDASITVTGATQTLYRSTAFTPTAGQTNYAVVSAANVTVKSARIVIIQEADTLTNTETQIEIGNYNTGRTAEAAAILTNPKYWKYTAANWDGTKTFYAEAVYNSGSMDTVTVGIYEATDITAPSWSLNATIVSAAETTTPTRTRVAFTPVDGRWYTIFSHNGSMDDHDIYRAGIVVQQAEGNMKDNFQVTNNPTFSLQGGDGVGVSEALGQSFTTTSAYSVDTIDLLLRKILSPADNLILEIVSTSITGTVLGTSDAVDGASLTTNILGTQITFTFSTPVSLSDATKYYLRLTRTGGRDTTNYYGWGGVTTSSYSGGGKYSRDNGIWSSESTTIDVAFILFASRTNITKLEPQYLLANTLLAAGTALQTFLTDWDSTEWDSVTNVYTLQAEAANGSTSDVTLEEADGGGSVTGSQLTNIDNAQISSALTMPTDQNLDVIANANAGDVAAARILVAVTVDAAAPAGPATVEVSHTRKRNPAVYSPGPAHYSIKNKLKWLFEPIYSLFQ